MITHPDDRMIVYDTVRALVTGRRMSKKKKERLAHRLLFALGDNKKKAYDGLQ